jgi:isoprenylcysteine carboxyl methyltransferase (ICMT) family protein YpbQ
MNPALAVLSLTGFLLMFVLPKVFFRSDGRMNLRWWMTAAPFGISFHGVWLAWAGITPRLLDNSGAAALALDIVGMLLIVGSVSMQFATMATNRVPLALWHQDGDQNAPKQIVTFGPYRFVRHPFYVSFILLTLGSAFITRDIITMGAVPLALLSLDWTVRNEERKLLASPLGGEYGAYRARTGRFFPKLVRS